MRWQAQMKLEEQKARLTQLEEEYQRKNEGIAEKANEVLISL